MTIISGIATFGLLVLLCKGMNDIIYVIAHKHQRYNGMAWVLVHTPWTRWSVGGITGAGIAFVIMVAWLDSCTPRDYVAPPERPAITNVYEAVEAVVVTNSPTEEEDDNAPHTTGTQIEEAVRLEIAKWAAATLWIEARGETHKGKVAVAEVIWNRAEQDPTHIIKVVRSTSWNGIPIRLRDVDKHDKAYGECWEIGWSMACGDFESTRAWTHFYNPQLARPAWGSQLIAKARVGRHTFGTLR